VSGRQLGLTIGEGLEDKGGQFAQSGMLGHQRSNYRLGPAPAVVAHLTSAFRGFTPSELGASAKVHIL
jgi:hypothetical protein